MTYPVSLPRGILTGTAVMVALVWALFLLGLAHLPETIVQTVLLLGLLVLTAVSRRLKVRVVRTAQRWVVNPLVRTALRVGVNPLGLVLLETTGRASGRPRRVPVGNGRIGDDLWVIAEHGMRAQYVRNVLADPRVRVRLRIGLRQRWVDGIAEVLPDDDALARQRAVIRGHPLRAFNAMNVRVLGADLVTVRVRLGSTHSSSRSRRPGTASTPVTSPTLAPVSRAS